MSCPIKDWIWVRIPKKNYSWFCVKSYKNRNEQASRSSSRKNVKEPIENAPIIIEAEE